MIEGILNEEGRNFFVLFWLAMKKGMAFGSEMRVTGPDA